MVLPKSDPVVYPDRLDIVDEKEGAKWLPSLLMLFMNNLLPCPLSSLKRLSIGQCIVQSVCIKSKLVTNTTMCFMQFRCLAQ